MRKFKMITLLSIMIVGLISSCGSDDTFDELTAKEPANSKRTNGDGNEGGYGGTNLPPS